MYRLGLAIFWRGVLLLIPLLREKFHLIQKPVGGHHEVR